MSVLPKLFNFEHVSILFLDSITKDLFMMEFKPDEPVDVQIKRVNSNTSLTSRD